MQSTSNTAPYRAVFGVSTTRFPMSAPRLRPLLALAALASAVLAPTNALLADTPATPPAAASPAPTPSLIANSDLETDANADAWPDHWSRPQADAAWLLEDGNHFLRLTSPAPGATTQLQLEVPIPAGTPALELTWRWRTSHLKAGKQPWFDARFILEFLDANRQPIGKPPAAPATRSNTKRWVEKRTAFLVPAGAVTLKLTPSLVQVDSGTLDLDDLVVRPADPAPILAALQFAQEVAQARFVPPETANQSKWPAPLRAQGNRLVDPSGNPVWLQGLNAGGLESVPTDTQPIKSTLVGIEEWKANVVRLPVSDSSWFGKNVLQKDGGTAYRDYVDQCVMLAANRGAYLVLDLHQFRAPKAEHAAFWKDAATRYKNHPAVIFDLFNEPFGISWEVWRNGGFVSNHTGLDESAFLSEEDKKKNQGFESVGMQGLLDTVRATGANNLVVVAGLGWSYNLTGITEGYALTDKTGNGIMYSWHVYNWHRGWEKNVLAAAAKHPILVGEVGADTKKMDFIPSADQESPYTWVPDMIGFIQKHRLNWTAWCFHPGATPVMISDWKYTPTPFWGVFAKDAFAGKQFELQRMR